MHFTPYGLQLIVEQVRTSRGIHLDKQYLGAFAPMTLAPSFQRTATLFRNQPVLSSSGESMIEDPLTLLSPTRLCTLTQALFLRVTSGGP